jgi:hypothetical protein
MAFQVKNLTQVLILAVLLCFTRGIVISVYQAYQHTSLSPLDPSAVLQNSVNGNTGSGPGALTNEVKTVIDVVSLGVFVYLCMNKMC